MAVGEFPELTNVDFGLQIRVDPAVATYITLDQSSAFTEEGAAATGDGQVYRHKGHANPVPVGFSGTGSFNIVQLRDEPRLAVREGTVALVRWTDSDGYGEKYEVLFTRVTKGRPHNGLPTWTGNFERRGEVIEIEPTPAVEPADPGQWAPP
jgi:hypothetical protein